MSPFRLDAPSLASAPLQTPEAPRYTTEQEIALPDETAAPAPTPRTPADLRIILRRLATEADRAGLADAATLCRAIASALSAPPAGGRHASN